MTSIYILILLAAITAGIYLRVNGISQLLFYSDEFHSLCNYNLPWSKLVRTYDQGGTGIPFLLLQKVSVVIFGADELTLRLPALIPGILAIPVAFFFFRLFFTPFVSSLVTLIFAVSHYTIYYSMTGRIYSLYLLLSMLAMMLVLRMSRETKQLQGICLAVIFGMMMFCHLSSVELVVTCSLYAVGTLMARSAPRKDWTVWIFTLAGACILATVLYLPVLPTVKYFLSSKAQFQKGNGIDFSQIIQLYAGGHINTILFAILVPIGLIAGIVKRTPYRVFVAWQLIISPLFLLIMKPVGYSGAHARYIIYYFPLLLISLVDALLVISGGVAALIGVKKRSIVLGLITILFTAVYWATGFEGLWIDRQLNINHLINKQFIEVDFPVPPFYEDIYAEENFRRVIEFPFFMRFSKRKSAQDMYMKYRQIHGKDVYIGEAVDTGNMNRYVNVFNLPVDMAGESCLVFHKNIRDEIKLWIQARGSGKEEDKRRSRMVTKQIIPACWFKEKNTIYDMEKILEDLRDLYGPPWRENDMLAVFSILPDK